METKLGAAENIQCVRSDA